MIVFSYVEFTAAGSIQPSSLEALAVAKAIAQQKQWKTKALVMAAIQPAEEKLKSLAHYGADEILRVLAPEDAFVEGLKHVLVSQTPSLLVYAQTDHSKNLMPQVAALCGAALLPDATAYTVSEEALQVTHPTYGENAIAIVEALFRDLVLMPVRPKAFSMLTPDIEQVAPVESVSLDFPAKTSRLVLTHREETATGMQALKKLEDAEWIVSGGRGLKGPEHFVLIEELAQAMGAAVGATRAVVDAGWRPHHEQVGQTGKTVRPKVYFALGISGAIQHQVGMSSSQLIIAVNKDAEAPIFEVADFGIVGDVFEVIPALKQAFTQHV
jgi:electron transfer flavoprotein alpha subunit